MASINDVAKKAGVGVSTVSKVLNNYNNISDATRAKVLAAVEELNYVPNSIASALSSKQGKRVALVIFINNHRQAIDEINMQYLFGAMNHSKELKIEVIPVFSNLLEGKNAKEILQHFNSLRVSAVIYYGLSKEAVSYKELIDMDVFPSVVVDAPIIGPRTSYVMVDHEKAQYDIAVKMIKRHKATRILYLAGRRDGYVTDLRMQGVVNACDELGVTMNAQYANFSEKRARELVKQHALKSDLVICASDLTAIGAVHGLKEIEEFRPVCGFDGITLLGYINYKIDTVRQDFYQVSVNAMNAVSRLLQGNPSEEILMDYELTTISYDDVIM
ncbi:LacI family DNA-binding transcriptional regulator [Erysipelothrix aquatica]|uniref:LacI family DNA-binding transcriptional regulator n=1 Tax=Erysipelothrix aquatica TaxID=2683714 RepID=UPI00135CD6CC|nr:LacI family DNA-binding transcriptional regulator [Erysipelothrix aquatica]